MALALCNTAMGGANKVLIIGIDGCRPDALLVARAPNIEALWREGAFSFHARCVFPTSSGPCWASLLTGVGPAKHGVLDNKCDRRSDKFPTLFERAKAEKPDVMTGVFTSWPDILKLIPPAKLNISMEGGESDPKTLAAAKVALGGSAIDLTFIQLDRVDGAGHKHGYGPDIPEYVEAIQQADKDVGEIVATIKARKTYAEENWLIIITTDHGGLRKRHGGKSIQESTVFAIVSGNGVKRGELFDPPSLVDIAPTVFEHLRLVARPEWNLDGRAILSDTSPASTGASAKP